MEENTYILIVDDNPDNLQVISAFLKDKNYRIALAMDGKSALEVLNEIRIDLVLLDVMMPDMDGFEVCQQIKHNPKTKEIPVIFVTALTETDDIVKAFTLGGIDYITKPIKGNELLARVETHLTIARLQQQLKEANENLEQTVAIRTSQLTLVNKELNNKLKELKNANELISQSIAERKRLQTQMVLAIVQSEENERTRISQELHDGLGPILTTVKLYLQWLDKPDALKSKGELLAQTISITEEAIVSVKEISNKLSPHVLANYGLEAAIESFVTKIKKTVPIDFLISIHIPFRLLHDIEILLYRVIIECINNTIKHANAKNVTIDVKIEDEFVIIKYADNGNGFDVSQVKQTKTGLGLVNMQNRVATLNGSLSIHSEVGAGMEVTIKMPYHNFFE